MGGIGRGAGSIISNAYAFIQNLVSSSVGTMSAIASSSLTYRTLPLRSVPLISTLSPFIISSIWYDTFAASYRQWLTITAIPT